MSDRLFIGVYPGGIVYADRTRTQGGDYKRLGFVFYATLKLELVPDCPADLAVWIRDDAARLQRRKGEDFQISACGQTVRLGE